MLELLTKGICGFGLMCSVAISDGIELFTNPIVHQEHNCPDIMNMSWDNYGFKHAAFSGVICSWWLIPVSLLLPYHPKVYFMLYIYNIITPLIMRYFQGPTPNNPYLGHTMLYIGDGLALAGISIANRMIIK